MNSRSDTERLNQLEALLRRNDAVYEFWFDPDVQIMYSGDQNGDTLRQVVDRLLDAQEH
jgi:hypothetical protein